MAREVRSESSPLTGRTADERAWLRSLGRLLGALLVLPLGAALVIAAIPLSDAFRDAREAQATVARLERILLVTAFVHQLQRERGLSDGFLAGGGANFGMDLAAQRAQVDRASVAGADALAWAGAASLAEALRTERVQIDEKALAPSASFAFYTDAITNLLRQIDRSMAAEPDARAAALLASFADLVHAKEYAGQERAVANRACAKGVLSPADFTELHRLGALQEGLYRRLHSLAPAAWGDLLSAAEAEPANAAALHLRQQILEAGPGVAPPVSAEAWWAGATARIDRLKLLEEETASRIRAEVTASGGRARRNAEAMLAGMAALLLLAALVGLLLVRAVRLGVVFDIRGRETAEREIRQLSEALSTTQEDERHRVVLALHDGAILSLQGLEGRLGELKRGISATESARLGNIHALVSSIIEEIRGLSASLRPGALDKVGLAAALLELAKSASTASCAVDLRVSLNGREPPPEVSAALLRVAQAAVGNVQRHSQASKAWIALTSDADRLTLEIGDNGGGFDPRSPGLPALGLLGMRQRVDWLRGEFYIRASPDKGTSFAVDLPLTPPTQ